MILSSSLVGHARVRASDSEAIQGCYQARTGDLRVVQAPSDCRPDEVALSWNSAGTGPGSIAARVRDQGPFPLIPLQTTEVPLTGDAWSQGANEFQDVFGQVHVDTPCPSFAVAVVPLIKVFLDGELRVTMLVTQPVSDFRIPSFEPGVERSHTLAVTITHRGCTQAGEAIVQSVKADVLRVVPRVP
jgi:hypothetical protein